MKANIYLVLFTLCVLGFQLTGQTPFEFANHTIPAGTKQHITVSLSEQDQETLIPITVFHGKTGGPVLGITAGVHGYEYAPILAGQKLISKIDPTRLSGTIILVQIANVPGFLGRSPYLNPQDGKNLNRSFPGAPGGSATERIADFISNKVIGISDYFVDMHSGDAPEDLMAYAAYYQNDNLPEISEQGRQMVMHMGFDHVVVFKTTGKDYMKKEFPSLYCSAEAFKAGIPAVDIECGRLGLVEPVFVDKIAAGIEHLLTHLGMQTGPSTPGHQIAFIEERSFTSSAHSGFFYPLKSSGEYVLEGMKVGYITDFFNRPLQDIYAEKSGIVLYILGTPPVNTGETLVSIGVIKQE